MHIVILSIDLNSPFLQGGLFRIYFHNGLFLLLQAVTGEGQLGHLNLDCVIEIWDTQLKVG